MQLYGFLLVDETVEQMYSDGYRVDRADFYGQAPRRPPPTMGAWLPGHHDDAEQSVEPSASAHPVSRLPAPEQLDRLDDHLLRGVLGNLGAEDLLRCMAAAHTRLARVAADVKQRRELVCFYSRAKYKEEGVVLGYGIHREWHGGRGPTTLRSLVARLDYLSFSAFRDNNVRRSAWNAPLDAFLPLYLNPGHGAKALQLLPGCLLHMQSRSDCTSVLHHKVSMSGMRPQVLLSVLAQAMNSLVVEMVKVDKGDVPTHMSDAALRAFTHLHHLLLAVALSPDGAPVVAQARSDVRAFVSGSENGRMRHKERCPDLGILLVELLLVPKQEVPWADFIPVFLRELLSRQVRWAIRECSAPIRPTREELGAAAASTLPFEFGVVAGEQPAGDSWHSFTRMRTHFVQGLTGLRTVALTCWFGLELARPATSASLVSDLAAIKRVYDECSGAPEEAQLSAFHAHAGRVMAMGSWGQALGVLGVALWAEQAVVNGVVQKPDVRTTWAAVLRQAVLDSWVSGYHDQPCPWGQGRRAHTLARSPAGSTGRSSAAASPPTSSCGGSDGSGAGTVGQEEWRSVDRQQPRTRRAPRGVCAGMWSPGRCSSRAAAVNEVFGGRPLADWEGPVKPVRAVQM